VQGVSVQGLQLGWGGFLRFSMGHLSGLVSAGGGGGHLRQELTLERHCLGARSYLSLCKILVKSVNPWPSYSDLTNL